MSEIENLKAENKALRATVRKLEDRVAFLELAAKGVRPSDGIAPDGSGFLDAADYAEVTTQDTTPPATALAEVEAERKAPAIPGYGHQMPTYIPRQRAAGEVLPPEQRASWARGRTEHDK